MIRAAIVGLGRWGRTLVNSVQDKSDKLRFTHAVSRDPAHVCDFTEQHGLGAVGALDAVLDNRDIDAVVLATPHSLHLEQILACARARKAVLCEKPLAMTKADALRAVEACREASVVLGTGTDKRFFPAMQALAQIAASGELGRLLHLEGNFSNEVAAAQFSGWRHSADESPAGGLTGTGIHVLDSFVHIAGPRAASPRSFCRTSRHPIRSTPCPSCSNSRTGSAACSRRCARRRPFGAYMCSAATVPPKCSAAPS